MIDGYTLRNISMFCFPIYGWLTYKVWKWPKLTPYVAYFLLAYVLLTIPYGNYAQKPHLLNKVIEIYQADKIAEKGIVYRRIPLKPHFWGGTHPSFTSNKNTKADDMVFRILVWQDMIKELMDNQAWFGMGFSHPLRSTQIEMLNIATSEWKKDGWISAHNSYLYVIYRTGIIGVIILIGLFIELYMCFVSFFKSKDITGICLLLSVFYYLIRANWMLEFELPYNACPLWMIFGLMVWQREQFPPSRTM